VIGGGTLGYNWQVSPNFVVGFEGTFDGTSIGNTSNIYPDSLKTREILLAFFG